LTREDAATRRAPSLHSMFSAIAGRYDPINHLLSANMDRRWRRACLEGVRERISRSEPLILDIGCGTADLSLVFSGLGPVVACDFCRPMLRIAGEKSARARKGYRLDFLEGDALSLPFADACFDVAVFAFALRNLADIAKGLREARRILRSGGTLGILEFGIPQIPLLRGLYLFYFTRILPAVGRRISGVDGAYSYLPASVRAFPPPEVIAGLIVDAGFVRVEYRSLSGGTAILFLANS
jgi:demethylmenaquinone methyltransferase / 2-methoxy-6-polyprenyl-1,4-benzoquinol methylase